MATGQDLIDHFEYLVDDDNTGETRSLVLINMAQQRLCSGRFWNFLRKEDTSNTLATATVSYSLPSDFLFLTDERSIKAIDSNNNVTQLKIVPYRERKEFQDHVDVVYLDVLNSNIIFPVSTISEHNGKTLNITYQHLPSDLTTATSPIFATPFHYILAYSAAKHFWYNDQVEKDRAWNKEMEFEYQMFNKEMIQWDNNLEHAIAPTFRPQPWINLEDGMGHFNHSDGYHF